MISEITRKGSNADLNSFGGRLRDARKETGMSGKQVCAILNGYLKAKGLKPVNINTFRSWEGIGTPKEISGKSYPHPCTYNMLGDLYGITGYWLFLGGMGGQIQRYKDKVSTPGNTDYNMEQRKAITTKALGYKRVELKFRDLLIGATNKQTRAIENLIDSMLDKE